jgi:hypothetical protein
MNRGIVYSRIDGAVPAPHRTKIIDDFQRNPEMAVLLMTIGTGAVGYGVDPLSERITLIRHYQSQSNRRESRSSPRATMESFCRGASHWSGSETGPNPGRDSGPICYAQHRRAGIYYED